MRYRVVARHIGGIFAHRHVTALVVVVNIGAHLVILARQGGRLIESLVGGVDIEIAQTLQPGVGNKGDGRIALHRPRFATVQFPLWHPAPFLVHANHRAYHIQLLVGVEECHQLTHVAVGVPE